MIFIWKDGQFYGSKVGFIETYNEAIKKRRLKINQKFRILANYYRTLNDVNERFICSERTWNKMNGGQKKQYCINKTRNNVVHFRKNDIVYVGFAKAYEARPHSIDRSCNFIRKIELTDNQLTDLKQKYSGFSLIWF